MVQTGSHSQSKKPPRFFKITNETETHRGLQYHNGYVEDILPFQKFGIYFSDLENIHMFYEHGVWIREVFPVGEVVCDGLGKYRAHAVRLGPRVALDDMVPLKEMGVPPTMHWIEASVDGRVDFLEWLWEWTPDIQPVDLMSSVCLAASHGCIAVLEFWKQKGRLRGNAAFHAVAAACISAKSVSVDWCIQHIPLQPKWFPFFCVRQLEPAIRKLAHTSCELRCPTHVWKKIHPSIRSWWDPLGRPTSSLSSDMLVFGVPLKT